MPQSKPRALQPLWIVNAWLARCAKALVVALTSAMVAAIAWQVVTRVFANRSPPWTEEIALLMFSWIILLMIAIGVREQLHVRVDALIAILPRAIANIAERVIALLVTCIGCYLIWSGTSYLAAMRGSTSQAIRYPSELLYVALPISGLLVFLFALENLMRGGVPSSDTDP